MKLIKDVHATVTLSEKFKDRNLRQWVLYPTGKLLCIGFGENYVNDRLTCGVQGADLLLKALLAQAALRCQSTEVLLLMGAINQAKNSQTGQPIKPLAIKSEEPFSFYSSSLTLLASVQHMTYDASSLLFSTNQGLLTIKTSSGSLVSLIKAILDLTVPRVADPQFLPELLTFYRNAVEAAEASKKASPT